MVEPLKEIRRAITNRHAPRDEVAAELSRVRAADPEFRDVTRALSGAHRILATRRVRP